MTSNDFAIGPGEAAADDLPIETTSARFRADVVDASMRRVVLVDFWAPWCAPCRQLAPMLERLVRAAKGKVRLVKVNIDQEPQIAAQLGVKSIPAVVAFQRGRPSDGFVGALPENQLKGFLERLVGPIEADEDVFLSIEDMLTSGDLAGAEAALTELAALEPAQPKAWAELLKLYVATERLEQATALLANAPDSLRRDATIAAAAAALENAIQASALDEIGNLHKRVDAHPDDPQARFDLALALNAKGLREEAAAQLLEIIQRDRNWSEDGARKQLVQFFEAWGPADKTAASARRKLSALLFA
jgi:putative thioredoxin